MKNVSLVVIGDLYIEISTYDEMQIEPYANINNIIKKANEDKIDIILIYGKVFFKKPLYANIEKLNLIFSKFKGKILIRDVSFKSDYTWCSNVTFINFDNNICIEENKTIFWINKLGEINKEYNNIAIFDEYNEELANTFDLILVKKSDIKIYNKKIIFIKRIIPSGYTDCGIFGYHNISIICKELFVDFIKCGLEYHLIEFDVTNKKNDDIEQYIKKNIIEDGDIYALRLFGGAKYDLNLQEEYLKSIANITRVIDDTFLDVNIHELMESNKNNILGVFISELLNKEDKISKKALEYGIKAFMEATK